MRLLKKTILLLVILGLVSPAAEVLAQVMTSGSYSIQSDSVNFAGNRSSSGSYSMEDTAGETATGISQSSDFRALAGYQQGSSTPIVPSTTTPPTTPPSSSSGSSGSIIQLTNVMNFRAIPQADSIALSWNNPLSPIFHSVRLIRSDIFFPGDINEGEVIYEGPAEYQQDLNVTAGVIYYYAIFAKDIYGNYSSGALAQARIAPSGEIVVVPIATSSDPFINIPIVPTADPDIAKLSLIDFDFFQSSIRLVNEGEGIVIDGSKNLTISLSYDKVPEILKTIAFTLIDPTDPSQVFPFLLRVNEEKTAYEATLAPLGRSGTYQMKVIVLDYKNQGLKRLEGSLKALVFEQFQNLTSDSKASARNVISLSIVILLILIVIFVVHRKRKYEAQ